MNFNIKNIHEWPVTLRLGAAGAVFCFIIFLGYYFDLNKLSADLSTAKQQEGDLKLQYESLMHKKTELKHDLLHLPMYTEQFNALKKSIIKHEELADVLNEILKIGANNHLYFSLFDPDPAIKDGDYEKLPIKVIAVGSYHQLADFMSQLANLPQLVLIGDFIISNENKNDVLGSKLAEQANLQNLLTAEIKLAVYYQPEVDTNGK